MAKKEIDVPFDDEGNQYTYAWSRTKTVPNYVFTDTLVFIAIHRGTSTDHIKWRSKTTGKFFTSGSAELEKLLSGITECTITLTPELTINGAFTFRKSGTSVFLTFAK